MTKINKIICDICDKEINVDNGMSMYESIKLDKSSMWKPKAKPELIKIAMDICIECSAKIEQHIKELKNES